MHKEKESGSTAKEKKSIKISWRQLRFFIHECMKRENKNDSNAKNTNILATQIYLIKYLRNFCKNLDWIGREMHRQKIKTKRNKIENNNKISSKLCVCANEQDLNERTEYIPK